MRTIAPLAAGALTALAITAMPLVAQSAERPVREVTARRQGISVNVGFSRGEADGSISEGPETGAGAGISYERPIGARHSWRAELSAGSVVSDIGLLSDGFMSYPSTLNLLRTSIGVGGRRYYANDLFIGAGAAVNFTYDCWVDQEGGSGFLGGQSIECEDMTTPPFESVSPTPSVALSGGLQRGRWELELRYDQGFGTSARSEDRTGTVRSIGAYLHYRFGKRAP